MSLQPEDPKLSAWLLGELSDEEAAEVKRAVAVDPALRMAVRDLERVQGVLAGALSPEAAGLFPRQRKSVLLEARRLDGGGAKVVRGDFESNKKVPLFFRFAAAAVLVLACWLLIRLPGGEGEMVADKKPVEQAPPSPSDQATWPSPAPVDPTVPLPATRTVGMEDGYPALLPRQFVRTDEHPSLSLPIQAGHHSLAWIKQSIRKNGRLPSVHAVRLEELINQFSLRPVGATGISRGVALSAEAIRCPWDDRSRLLILSWRGAADGPRDIQATFRPDTATVSSYRLLGYARMAGAGDAALPGKLEAAKVHTVLLEVRPAGPSGSFGAIEWTVDGQSAPLMALAEEPSSAPSADARFAELVAAFSLWLAGQSDALDGAILKRMAADLPRDGLGESRRDFLQLIDEAVAVAGR